jgi:hypothetical protein
MSILGETFIVVAIIVVIILCLCHSTKDDILRKITKSVIINYFLINAYSFAQIAFLILYYYCK